MDLEYFKEQIEDELHGAKCYAKNAIEIKAMSPNWANKFLEMSATELNHATNLYNMAQEYHKKISESFNEVPKYIDDTWKYIADIYADKSAKVKYIHDMYNK